MSGVLAVLLLGGCTKDLPPCGDDDWCLVRQGEYHVCALRGDGRASCWAWHGYDEPESVDGIYDECSQHDNCGQVSLLPDDETFVDLQFNTSSDTVCGLTTDGDVLCWGLYYDELSQDGGVEGFESFSVGMTHGCGLRPGGMVECWGELWGQSYESGYQTYDGSLEPPEDLGGVIALDCGKRHCCALTADGVVECWGIDDAADQYDYGQVSSAPSDSGYAQLVSGWDASCALHEETEQWWCWGDHGWCEVGTPPCFAEDAAEGLAPLDDTELSSLDIAELGIGLDHKRKLVGVPDADCSPWPEDDWTYRQLDRGTGACGLLDDFSLLCWGYDLVDSHLVDAWEGVWTQVPTTNSCDNDQVYRLAP